LERHLTEALDPMARVPGLVSNNSALETAVADWLVESRMPLPAGFRLSLEVVDVLPVLEDARTSFLQGSVEIRAGEPGGWVHLRWPGFAVARIEELRPGARVLLTRDALPDLDRLFRGFLLIVLIFLWKRDQRFHVHAGIARDPHGRGWMLVGNSHSGKSTTIALLASRGWQVGTDDIGFLMDCGKRMGVMGFRDRIALRPEGYQLLGAPGGEPLARRNKAGFWPEDLGAEWVQTVEPDLVVFTQAIGERTVITKAEPKEILANLIQNSLWVMFEATGATEHLELLSRLGSQARCFRATLGPDLFSNPDALAGFLP
jgi:hypothetical protein